MQEAFSQSPDENTFNKYERGFKELFKKLGAEAAKFGSKIGGYLFPPGLFKDTGKLVGKGFSGAASALAEIGPLAANYANRTATLGQTIRGLSGVGDKLGKSLGLASAAMARFIGFAIGICTFAFLTNQFMGEGINMKTLVSLILAIMLVLVQMFWK